MRFRDAAGRVILIRWHEMMSYEQGTLLGEDIEELHAMRVSSRRLRSALDAFEGAFPPKRFRPYVRQVKRITDVLGDARDLDVAIERLQAMATDAAPDERPGLYGLIDRFHRERRLQDPVIAELFADLHRRGFPRKFERFVTKHTGVRRKDLALAKRRDGA
jgi:CHAD domain-containing protein